MFRISKSISFNKDPPPVNIIPKSMISKACSGGVLSSALLIAFVIWKTVSAKACLISSDYTSTVFGIPIHFIERPRSEVNLAILLVVSCESPPPL